MQAETSLFRLPMLNPWGLGKGWLALRSPLLFEVCSDGHVIQPVFLKKLANDFPGETIAVLSARLRLFSAVFFISAALAFLLSRAAMYFL